MTASPSISEIAERLEIPQLWQVLSLPGKSGKCVCSPFREDSSPSFSVYQDAGRWRFRDHASAEHGDALDFVKLARGCDAAEALRWAKAFLGLPEKTHSAPEEKKRWIPDLRPGTGAEMNALGERRGFGIEAQREATSRGFFGFTEFAAASCWAVRDCRRQLMEFRRLDGRHFEAYKSLPARKSHCIGSGKSWPLGIEEAEGFQKVALLEGAADFVAVFNFLAAEGKEKSVAPIAMLGAANHRIADEALRRLAENQAGWVSRYTLALRPW